MIYESSEGDEGRACPNCDMPNQFGELCDGCRDVLQAEIEERESIVITKDDVGEIEL